MQEGNTPLYQEDKEMIATPVPLEIFPPCREGFLTWPKGNSPPYQEDNGTKELENIPPYQVGNGMQVWGVHRLFWVVT